MRKSQKNLQIFQENLIPFHEFLNFIGFAAHPDIQDAQGIDCVLNRMLRAADSGWMFPVELRPEDKKALIPLLEKLPPLHGRMSEEEIEEFMAAYRQLPDKLPWEPSIISAGDRAKNNFVRGEAIKRHRNYLEEAFFAGKVSAFDSDHLPVKRLTFGAYIEKNSAIKYLQSYCLWQDNEQDDSGCQIYSNQRNEKIAALAEEVSDEQVEFSESEQEFNNKKLSLTGLKTRDMACAFAGLNEWNADKWKKCLSDGPKWILEARIQPGRRGVRAALWDPYKLAKLAREKKSIPLDKLGHAFQHVSTLSPWKEQWATYESESRYFEEL